MEEWSAAVNVPPLHPWCRCVLVPYINTGIQEERAARNDKGRTKRIEEQTYDEWKSGIRAEPPKEAPELKQAAERLKIENFPPALTSKSEWKNTQIFIDYINNLEGADPNVVKLYNSMGKLESIEKRGVPFKLSHGKDSAVSYVSKSNGDLIEAKLTIPKLKGNDLTGQINTTLHEEMHLIDMYCRVDPAKAGNFFSTSKQSLIDVFKNTSDSIGGDILRLFKEYDTEIARIQNKLIDDFAKTASELDKAYRTRSISPGEYSKKYSALKRELMDRIDYECRNAMGGGVNALEDIYDALSGGRYMQGEVIKCGHGVTYYRSFDSRIKETLANYGSLSVTRSDLVELLKADKPELVKELEKLISDMLKKVE
jgi:hypothetical protein|uniref:Minor capsid protein n=1 Tax=Siphoviridae sp. ctedO8 TaxID=2827907 RepID=A0A8S5T3X0_9CAUD|nr:MAG TPA: minor capsid protein [Siphoviridae sp. ctedO8]